MTQFMLLPALFPLLPSDASWLPFLFSLGAASLVYAFLAGRAWKAKRWIAFGLSVACAIGAPYIGYQLMGTVFSTFANPVSAFAHLGTILGILITFVALWAMTEQKRLAWPAFIVGLLLVGGGMWVWHAFPDEMNSAVTVEEAREETMMQSS